MAPLLLFLAPFLVAAQRCTSTLGTGPENGEWIDTGENDENDDEPFKQWMQKPFFYQHLQWIASSASGQTPFLKPWSLLLLDPFWHLWLGSKMWLCTVCTRYQPCTPFTSHCSSSSSSSHVDIFISHHIPIFSLRQSTWLQRCWMHRRRLLPRRCSPLLLGVALLRHVARVGWQLHDLPNKERCWCFTCL